MKTKIKTKRKNLKMIIENSQLLLKNEKNDWLNILDQFNDNDILRIEKYILQLEEKEHDYMMQLIFKHGLEDKFYKSLKNNVNKVKRVAIKYEEKHLKKSTGDPEKILDKLNKL